MVNTFCYQHPLLAFYNISNSTTLMRLQKKTHLNSSSWRGRKHYTRGTITLGLGEINAWAEHFLSPLPFTLKISIWVRSRDSGPDRVSGPWTHDQRANVYATKRPSEGGCREKSRVKKPSLMGLGRAMGLESWHTGQGSRSGTGRKKANVEVCSHVRIGSTSFRASGFKTHPRTQKLII